MKRLLALMLCAVSLGFGASAQMVGYTAELDTLFLPTSTEGTYSELAGYATYSVYANFLNPTDFLSVLYADVTALGTPPMGIDAACGCYQDGLGVGVDALNDPMFYDVLPLLEFDSFYTIGLANIDGSNNFPSVIGIQDTVCQGLVIDDGAIYTIANTDDNGTITGPSSAFAGEDLRVLVARITTCGDFTFQACTQTFIGQSLDSVMQFCPEALFVEHLFDGDECIIDSICSGLGCADPMACNFNVEAQFDDGSCMYPGAVCDDGDESTENDVFVEGCVCLGTPVEVPGCTDLGACNYNPISNINDGSCLYFDALGDCGGACTEDANSDGICDDLLNCVNIGAAFWEDLDLGAYISDPSPIISDTIPVLGVELTVGDDFTEEFVLNVPLVFVDEVTGGAFQVLSWSNLTAEGLPPGAELILPQTLDGGSQTCVELTGADFPTEAGLFNVVITGEVLLNIFGAPFSIGDVSTSFWVEVVSNPNGVPGCMYPTASNYMPWATYDSGVCEYAGCIDPTALNYSPRHSVDDGSCFYNDPNCVAETSCPEDLNGDGAVGTPDLLLMLGEYGNFCD